MTTNLTAVASKVERKRGTSLPSATDNGGPRERERSRSERRTLLRVLREVSCVDSVFGRRLSTDCASRSCNGDPCSRFQAPRAIHPRPWQRHEQREEQPVRQTCERWGWHLFWAQATAIGERRHLMAIWRAFVAFTASFLPHWKTPATLMREGLFASIHKTNHRVCMSGCPPLSDFKNLQEHPNKRRAYTHASKDPPWRRHDTGTRTQDDAEVGTQSVLLRGVQDCSKTHEAAWLIHPVVAVCVSMNQTVNGR